MELKEEIKELKNDILAKLADTNSIVDEYNNYRNFTEQTILNSYNQLVHLIGDGQCRIITKNGNTNIRCLDTEMGYNYHLIFEKNIYNGSFYSNFEIKKISNVTCGMISEIRMIALKNDVIKMIIDYANLNEEYGNSIKKVRSYSEINKADDFATELTKYLSKETRLRKINSVLG